MPTPEEDLPREPLADPELCGRFAAWFAAALGNRSNRARPCPRSKLGVTATSSPAGPTGGSTSTARRHGAVAEVSRRRRRRGRVRPRRCRRAVAAGWRARGVARAPGGGDPLGLTGSGPFSAAALEAECGGRCLSPTRLRIGLIPTPRQARVVLPGLALAGIDRTLEPSIRSRSPCSANRRRAAGIRTDRRPAGARSTARRRAGRPRAGPCVARRHQRTRGPRPCAVATGSRRRSQRGRGGIACCRATISTRLAPTRARARRTVADAVADRARSSRRCRRHLGVRQSSSNVRR